MPIKIPELADLPYRPSNGTEAVEFEALWCLKCTRGEECDILLAAWAYSLDESGYPSEWVHDKKGVPKCTAFVKA